MIITVVIPCRNEVGQIKECIQTIYNSKLDKEFELEVLVVDGLSDDGTIEVLTTLCEDYPTLKIVENVAQVTPVAFNLGIKKGKGDFFQIIGARQLISENYLQDAVKSLLEDDSIWCVGGMVENVYLTPESEIIGKAMASPFGVGGGNFRVIKESSFTDTVGTPMYPARVFKEIGLFDESLVRNQDDELNYRVTKAGGKILLNANILIKYFVRAKISQLKKQYYQYGYWKVFVNKKHKTITTVRQLFPLFLVLGLLFGVVLSLIIPFFWFVLASGVFAYALMALYFAKQVGEGGKEILSISTIFPILHFSYGFGYFMGCIDFFILNKKPSSKNKQLSRG